MIHHHHHQQLEIIIKIKNMNECVNIYMYTTIYQNFLDLCPIIPIQQVLKENNGLQVLNIFQLMFQV